MDHKRVETEQGKELLKDKDNVGPKTLMFDDILLHINEFGLYQKRLYLLIIIPVIFGSAATMSSIFYLSEHSHRCTDEYDVNYTSFECSRSLYIPQNNSNVTITYHQCNIEANTELYTNTTATTIKPCISWIYDRTLYKQTVISEMNLVCDRTSLKSHGKMVVYLGYLTGGFIAGTMADIFGRKSVFCVCLVIKFLSNLLTVWAPNYIIFVVFRFLYGMSGMGYFTTAMVIGLEMVGPSKRKWTGIGIYFFWCLGEIFLCIVAYITRDWRTLQLVISVPMVFFCFYYWLIPESARWLMSRGKIDEASIIFRRAATVNKRDIEYSMIKEIHLENRTYSTRSSLLMLLKSPKMLLITGILAINWFVASSGYHGLSLNVGNLAGDVYINFLISIFVEIFAYTCCALLSDRIGRRIFYCSSLLIGGVSSLIIIIPSTFFENAPPWITVALAMIGKSAISAVFAQVFVYSSELYPTSVRTLALGFLNVTGTVGSMASPYISDIANYTRTEVGSVLPVLIFGSLMTVSGLLSCLLPETRKIRLPETTSDIELRKIFK